MKSDKILMKYMDRNIYSDCLKTIAVLLIILCHVSGNVMLMYNSSAWWTGNILDSMTRGAVPLFIMISGMLLLGKEESIKKFFSKRFNKVFIPFIIASVGYSFWKLRFGDKFSFATMIKNIVQGNAYGHLWFIYMIIGLYLLTPALRAFLKNIEDKYILHFLIFSFMVTSVIPFIQKITGIRIGIDIEFISIYVILFIAGYYFNKIQIDKKYRMVIYILGVAGYFITVIGTYKMSSPKNIVDLYYYDFASPNVVCMALAIFIWFKNIHWIDIFSRFSLLAKFSFETSKASYGIYLIHILFLDIYIDNLSNIDKIFKLFQHPVLWITIGVIGVFIASFTSIKVILLTKEYLKIVLLRKKDVNIKYDSLRA